MAELSGGTVLRPVVVKQATLCVLLMLCMALVACAHWRDSYFDNGVGVLTQSDVKGKTSYSQRSTAFRRDHLDVPVCHFRK